MRIRHYSPLLGLLCLSLMAGCRKPDRASSAVSSAKGTPSGDFYEAALNGVAAPVKRELARGVDVNARNAEAQTALMLASFNGHTAICAELLNAGADVALRDARGRNALMFASTGPAQPVVELLLQHAAEVNAVDEGERWTALMFAAAEGQTAVVEALLAAGADPTLIDIDGDSAADFARERGHTALAALIASAEKAE